MENKKEHMNLCGFADNDLLSETEYWDYTKYSEGKRLGIEPDSIKYVNYLIA